MGDVLILPERSKPWVLGMVDGEVVRLSGRSTAGVTRQYFSLRVFCGGMKDKPVEIKQMQRAYDREARANAC